MEKASRIKKILISAAIVLPAVTVNAGVHNGSLPARECVRDIGNKLWRPIEVAGVIEYSVEEKNGTVFVRLPVIVKDGLLYKLHIAVPFLQKENILPGTQVTVYGKARPSLWTKDRSVSVLVFSIQANGRMWKVPGPGKAESEKK